MEVSVSRIAGCNAVGKTRRVSRRTASGKNVNWAKTQGFLFRANVYILANSASHIPGTLML
jgi:hypothetical protein